MHSIRSKRRSLDNNWAKLTVAADPPDAEVPPMFKQLLLIPLVKRFLMLSKPTIARGEKNLPKNFK